jgi:hypothetical protein
MWGAIDKKFESVYNQLIDLLDTGYMTELTVNSKKIRIEISPKVGIEITVDDVKVFGVDSSGRIFAQSISNQIDNGWFAEMGVTGGGVQQGLTLTSPTTAKYVQITENAGTVLFQDKNEKVRLSINPDGSFTVYDAASTQELVVWCDFTNGFIQLHAPRKSPYKDHAIGVDQTGAYKITAGVKAYL